MLSKSKAMFKMYKLCERMYKNCSANEKWKEVQTIVGLVQESVH